MSSPAFVATFPLVVAALVAIPAAREDAEPVLPPALEDALARSISAERYALVSERTDERWRADNHRHDLRVVLSSEGIELSPADATVQPWRLRLGLESWGRGETLTPVGDDARCTAAGARLVIDRGSLSEWYVNDERGFEQGFTISSPPPGSGERPLRLVLGVDGGFSAEIRAGGRDALFSSTSAEVEYTGLRAWDATGRELDARFALDGERFSILVEDGHATYPVTVDPWLWTQEAKLTAGDGTNGDQLGYTVSLSGDTALLGAPWDDDAGSSSGSAYVFVRSGTTWSQQAKLTASDAASHDNFGYSVSLSGFTALVGSPEDDDGGAASGSTYVFVRSGTNWTQQVKLTAPDAGANDYFGRSVSLSGDTALIGAYLDDDGGSASGSSYVFERSGTLWSQQAKLTASDGAPGDQFGGAVSLSGDTALVGAAEDDDLGSESGSAYVFVRTGTTWNQQTKLTAGDGAADDLFGSSVSYMNDRAIVGAYGDDDAGSESGSAYVFGRVGISWSQTAKLTASDAAPGDRFGWSVSIIDRTALVSALRGDGAAVDSGSVYAFGLSGTTWFENSEIHGTDTAADDEFGRSLSFFADTLLVGAPLDDDVGGWSGSAYVFERFASASATFRNAGSNPASLTAITMPVIGNTYTTTVNLTGTTGHWAAVVLGYLAPLSWTLGGGQVVLVDIADPNGEQLLLAPASGPVVVFDLLVPSDLSFVGIEAFTQAVHFGGTQPFALSNALDLFLGF